MSYNTSCLDKCDWVCLLIQCDMQILYSYFSGKFCYGSAGKVAEDPAACGAIAREVGAIQQLILMALSENEVVVQQACKTIGVPSIFHLFK